MSTLSQFLLFLDYFLHRKAALAGLSVYALLCWFFLTEYWMARLYPGWEGGWEYAFLVPAIGGPVLLAGLGVLLLKREHRSMAPEVSRRLLVTEATPAHWAAMLREAARHRQTALIRSFLCWQAGMLEKGSTSPAVVARARIPSVWRRSRIARLVGSAAFLILLASPFPVSLMEAGAALWPQVGNGWRVTRLGPRGDEELLRSGRDREFVRMNPEKTPDGWLEIAAPDFPRTYRRLRGICGGDTESCTLANDSDHQFHLAHTVRLRGGRAVLQFRSAPAVLDLHLELTLLGRDGITALERAIVH